MPILQIASFSTAASFPTKQSIILTNPVIFMIESEGIDQFGSILKEQTDPHLKTPISFSQPLLN
jgi:hypothetical protein